MPQPRSQELEQMIRAAHAQVAAQVTSAEEANDVHLSGRDSDQVLTRLEALLDGRVGDPMPPDELDAARKEAKRRGDHKIPPGYADKDKSDSSGDYLVWQQLLVEANKRQIPVILVTDDQKEDWVRREHGLTLGPRPELYEEMTAATGAPFCLFSTATFLRYAEEYLSVSVSPETVDQAQELPAALAARDLAARDERELQLQVRELEAEIAHTNDQLQLMRQEAHSAARNVEAMQRLNSSISAGTPADDERVRELEASLIAGQALKERLDAQMYYSASGLRALETRRIRLRASLRALRETAAEESEPGVSG